MRKNYLQPEITIIRTSEDMIRTSVFDKNETQPMPLFNKTKDEFGSL